MLQYKIPCARRELHWQQRASAPWNRPRRLKRPLLFHPCRSLLRRFQGEVHAPLSLLLANLRSECTGSASMCKLSSGLLQPLHGVAKLQAAEARAEPQHAWPAPLALPAGCHRCLARFFLHSAESWSPSRKWCQPRYFLKCTHVRPRHVSQDPFYYPADGSLLCTLCLRDAQEAHGQLARRSVHARRHLLPQLAHSPRRSSW